MWSYTLCIYLIVCINSTTENELMKSVPPYRCTSTRNSHDSGLDLHCSIPDNTEWAFKMVQTWAGKHNVKEMNVHIKCEENGSISLHQPVKSRGLVALYIEGCKIRKFYRYDLSTGIHLIPFTMKTMEVIDSIHVITYRELDELYSRFSADVNSKYPCYISPSLERYVERNVSVIPIRNGHIDRCAKTRHHRNIPICNYTHLAYYEKSISTTNKLKFVSRFLNKGYFPSLRVLNFTRLHLKSAPGKLRRLDQYSKDFPELLFVDLSYNKLSQIEFGSFQYTRKHLSVSLSSNGIRVITAAMISTLRAVYPGVILLHDNPLSCQCDQHDLLQFCNSSLEPFAMHYKYLESERCRTPLKYRNYFLRDVPFDKECQRSEKYSHSIALTVILISLVICCILVIITYLFYNKCIVCLQCKRREEKQHTKSTKYDKFEYDAFISYSCEDETWVKIMCRRLEGPPYHAILCLHNRHFVPGVAIADNIFKSVQSSRITVVVLSEHFLNSQWCMMEFREANHKSMLDNIRHLVVIMLDDLTDVRWQLPPDIKLFLQTHTYLRVNEFGFWEKLVSVIVNDEMNKDMCSSLML